MHVIEIRVQVVLICIKSSGMIPALTQSAPRLVAVGAGAPTVSLLIPFEPKITSRSVLESSLQSAMKEVKMQLDIKRPNEETYMVLVRLGKLIERLNYGTYKKSAVIFLSAGIEKVFYLDMDVQQRIAVDVPLTMRNVAESKADARNHLLLVINDEHVRIFHGNSDGLTRLQTFTAGSVSEYMPGSGNGSVLRYLDHCLDTLLIDYPFPVVVMASGRMCLQFKTHTYNAAHVVAYMHGDFEDESEARLREDTMPLLAHWKQHKQQHVLQQLEQARKNNKLARGMREVCKEICEHRGKMLVVEKSFHSRIGAVPNLQVSGQFYIQDNIDEAIARLLDAGADVEFVEDGVLKEYKHVALITK
jgi:hypothetical protein